MTLHVEVDLGSNVPPYEQIRLQLAAHVAAGRLAPGDRLPTIRALATDLGVAAGTVARAYRELEGSGVIVTRRRTGTVVADGAATARSGIDDVVRAQAVRLVAAAHAAGVPDEDVLSLVRGELLQRGPRT